MRVRSIGLIGAITIAVFLGPREASPQQAVLIVRHAQIELEDPARPPAADPPLIEAGHQRARMLAASLKDVGITAIFTSDSRRTIQTAEPLAKALQIPIQPVPRRESDGLIGRIREQHREDKVLIVAHSQTIPTLLKALGYSPEVKIERTDYSNLLVVVPKSEGPPVVLRLRY